MWQHTGFPFVWTVSVINLSIKKRSMYDDYLTANNYLENCKMKEDYLDKWCTLCAIYWLKSTKFNSWYFPREFTQKMQVICTFLIYKQFTFKRKAFYFEKCMSSFPYNRDTLYAILGKKQMNTFNNFLHKWSQIKI